MFHFSKVQTYQRLPIAFIFNRIDVLAMRFRLLRPFSPKPETVRFSLLLFLSLGFPLSHSLDGHSGRTDSKGGHYNRSTGQYHYHGKPSFSGTSGYSSQTYRPSASKPANRIQKNSTHWLSLNSNKRHNSSCRYFKKSRGRLCGPFEGIGCKLCELGKSFSYSPKLSTNTGALSSESGSKKKENGSFLLVALLILGALAAVYFWKKSD
jgi:hypothetical protein